MFDNWKDDVLKYGKKYKVKALYEKSYDNPLKVGDVLVFDGVKYGAYDNMVGFTLRDETLGYRFDFYYDDLEDFRSRINEFFEETDEPITDKYNRDYLPGLRKKTD